jgi:redox-sensing transcriptional repressor
VADVDTPRVIPEPSLRRLPQYHQFLVRLARADVRNVSCSQIGVELKYDPTQVRKDLAFTGINGKPNVGYGVTDLIRGIEDLLGWNNVKDAFLAGAGNLGAALLGYSGFKQRGLNIVAAFDIDPQKIGRQVAGKHVLSLSKLSDLARRMHIHLGIIATPEHAAQSVAHLMVEGGIRAIWNFAPVHLKVPDNVIVQSESLESSLGALSFKVEQALKAELGKGSTDNGREPGGGLAGQEI